MDQAAKQPITPRHEPEVVAAQVCSMLAPFFRRPDADASAILIPAPKRPSPAARVRLERAIEFAISALDDIDGDADLEGGCDDDIVDECEPEESDWCYVEAVDQRVLVIA